MEDDQKIPLLGAENTKHYGVIRRRSNELKKALKSAPETPAKGRFHLPFKMPKFILAALPSKVDDFVPPKPRRPLSFRTKAGFAVGHVLNDLCASMWFTYLLIFMEKVLSFDGTIAGAMVLLGQVVDAISTPFVGIESDRTDDFWMCRYGRRKTWHLLGTVLTICSFPFFFAPCIGCSDSSQWAQFVYFGAFISIFQFAWACVQVAHVTLITDLSPRTNERVGLNAYRYAFTVISNVTVYGGMWVFLGFDGDSLESQLSPKDAPLFKNFVFTILGVGTIFSIVFHFCVKEPPVEDAILTAKKVAAAETFKARLSQGNTVATISKSNDKAVFEPNEVREIAKRVSGQLDKKDSKPEDKRLTWKDFLKRKLFYKVAAVYSTSRLYVNLSQIYTALYLQEYLKMGRISIAIFPLVTYVSGFLSSVVTKPIASRIGSKWFLFIGCIVGIASCVWTGVGSGEDYKKWQIFVVFVFYGIGGAMMIISSLAITADLIGNNTQTGAFVFGAMSFFDKMLNGIVAMVIQTIHTKETDPVFYRDVLCYVCGAAALLTILSLGTLIHSNAGARQTKESFEESEEKQVETAAV